MCKRFKRLGDAELEIMQILWRENTPLSAGQIHTALQGQRSWALSTLMTRYVEEPYNRFLARW